MAPALTAEPLSPKEKLTSTASPATRQSSRKLEITQSASASNNSNSSSDNNSNNTATAAVKKSAIPTALSTTSTRVTRSKDAAQRQASPIVVTPNNKRKVNNNNISSSSNIQNNTSGGGANIKPQINEQMGLSAANAHTTTSASESIAIAAVNTTGNNDSVIGPSTPPPPVALVATAEHNNNNSSKDNSTAQLLADLTSDFEEAITAEICLRKTLPEVSLGKESAATTTAAVSSPATDPASNLLPCSTLSVTHMDEQSTSSAAAAAQAATLATAPTSLSDPQTQARIQPTIICTEQQQQQELPHIISSDEQQQIVDHLEERLSQLDGGSLPPVVDITGGTLATGVTLPPPPQQQPLTLDRSQDQQLQDQQLQEQQQQQLLASPQTQQTRQSATLLTPINNFLKDGTAGAILDQDIDEVLKVLQTLDGSHGNPDAICDFNFFLNNDEEAAAPAASGIGVSSCNVPSSIEPLDTKPSCSSSIINSSIEPNDVAQQLLKAEQPPSKERLAELEQNYHLLVRKVDFLLRRMRKFQARQMCHHVSEEIAGVFEWAARTSNKAPQPVRSSTLSEQDATVMSIVSGRPLGNFWSEQKKQALPASQLGTFLRHIDTVARQQQICHTIGGSSSSLASSSTWYSSAATPGKRPRKQLQDGVLASNQQGSTTAGISSTTSADKTPRTDEIVPDLDTYVTGELTHVSGMLHTELREVQNAIDSDATESSSGGESADEMVTYNNSQQLSLSITRRAVWRYSRDRAAIALRWSWLCAQIADLSIKIRQHNDLFNELSRTKGDVILAATPPVKNVENSSMATTTTANGYKSATASSNDGSEGDYSCSRSRPLVLSEFRKRKLFQTTNMHTISKKAARPSNIKCGCQWPQVPCTLCTGRPDPTAPRELPETLMPQSRVGLLDSGYHPVLSFPEDISQSLHIEAISRQPDWQYRVMRCQTKTIVKNFWKGEREALAASGGGTGAGRRSGEAVKRRYVRRKERNNTSGNNNNNNNNSHNASGGSSSHNNNNNTTSGVLGSGAADSGNGTAATKQQQRQAVGNANASIMSTNSILPLHASRPHQQQMSSNPSTSLISSKGAKKPRKLTANNSMQQLQQTHSSNYNHSNNNIHNSQLNGDNNSSSSSKYLSHTYHQWENTQRSRNSSPTNTGGGGGSGKRQERSADRRSRMIYDIDNIVIPYSVAAATRPEILPYKEIPTPKWRVVGSDSKKSQKTLNADQTTEKPKVLINGCASQSPITAPIVNNDPNKVITADDQKNVENSKIIPKASVKVNGLRLNLKQSPKEQSTQPGVAEPAVKLSEQQTNKYNNNTLVNGNGLSEPKGDVAPSKETKAAEESAPKNKINNIHNKTNNVIHNNNNNSNKKTAEFTTKLEVTTTATTKVGELKETASNVEQPPSKRSKLQAANPITDESKADEAAKTNGDESGEEIEDLSDEAFLERHHRALLEERKRFETFLKFPWSTRSRANRRVDSRAESSGANTPDPTSPAPHLHNSLSGGGGIGADNESIPSPLAQHMFQHPLDGLNEAEGNAASGSGKAGSKGGKRQERRRTTSSKQIKDVDRRSATPDSREEQRPPLFEPLQFPLSDEVYQKMLAGRYAEPKSGISKRVKSKSISLNGDGSYMSRGSRRSSKVKASGSKSKLAQQPHINGDDVEQQQQATSEAYRGIPDDYDDGGVDYDHLSGVELMEEDDDDYPKHHLAPLDDEQLPPNYSDPIYDACYNAYTGAPTLDEEDLDDPFMDDDPNDPEWKRSIAVRHERMRKRV
ncbi:uncharacterized protein LOC115625161 isoform X2 [Scaptodrosophila lebanonensis]|uniref:Uncharacterized protein LOC115625161 isoform X2 n=1 Tax=Drosophila lebanonensis TaxID=7225 RepID=A0A6J2TGW2_DROLE|nr:uncharacterized protein LOC115625161 isoform X2 [Scaptodrosophila lebanonensis]